MLYYFAGEDRYQVRLAITDLAERAQAKIKWVDIEEAKQISPREWAGRGTSLFGKNIVVIRQIEALPVALQKEVVDAKDVLAQSPNTIILWEGNTNKHNTLKRKLKPYVQDFSCPPAAALVTWLEEEAVKRKSRLEKKAAESLVDRLGDDRWVLLGELEKLTLVYENITVQEVKQAIPEHLETTVFVMLDNLVQGRQQGVTKSVEQLIESGAGELYILSMLAYQFRTLLTIRQAMQQGEQPKDLKPFVIQKNRPIAERFSSAQLLDILTRILATDFAIKQGTVEPRTAVWLLITGLTAQMQNSYLVRSRDLRRAASRQ